MDRLIRRFDSVDDGDLALCLPRGVAYQRSASTIAYDGTYLAKVDAYDGTPIAKAVNRGRLELLSRHVAAGSTVLDVGAGSGAFVRDATAAGYEAAGLEVMPEAAARLRAARVYADNPQQFEVVTMWDSLEHMADPEKYLGPVRTGAHLFASLPVFEDLRRIRESKHYRPGEHLYYFTKVGFVDWMARHGFRLLEYSEHEMAAGRESIGAFALRRDLPDYHEHIAAYKEMHATRHYGSSATGEYLDLVARVVSERKPRSILDYGCGRSDLVAHFWRDGERRIERYDPAVPAYKVMPEGKFDLAFCCDVLEHIPMSSVERVLTEVREKTACALFTISTKLARAKLPDGRNAHVTLLTKTEWTRWVASIFGPVKLLSARHDHELVLLAGPA